MHVSRDAEIVSGFTIENPFSGFRAITHCGEALCSRRHHLDTHTHRGIELMYLVSGRVSWLIGGATVDQKAGELCVVGPARQHCTAPVAHPEFKALYVGLDLDALGKEGARLLGELEKAPTPNLGHFPDIEPVMRGLFLQAMSDLSDNAEIARRYADLLVAMAGAKLRIGGRAHERVALLFSYPLQKAIHHLRRNLHRRIPVSELARTAHLSAAHFTVRFRREVGVAPAAYHRRCRLEAARELLRTPEASIVLISDEFGFSSSQHFSASFRCAFGCTPRQWGARAESRRRPDRPSESLRLESRQK